MFPDSALPPPSDEWVAKIRGQSAGHAAGMASTIPRDVVRDEAIPDTLFTLTKRA